MLNQKEMLWWDCERADQKQLSINLNMLNQDECARNFSPKIWKTDRLKKNNKYVRPQNLFLQLTEPFGELNLSLTDDDIS